MADISKCRNNNCSLKLNCWRFNAPSGVFQSYSSFEPDENNNCEMFLSMNEDELQEEKLKQNKQKNK